MSADLNQKEGVSKEIHNTLCGVTLSMLGEARTTCATKTWQTGGLPLTVNLAFLSTVPKATVLVH